LKGNVTGQHYWQQLTVTMWKFCVNWTALLATADSGNVEVLCEFLKHGACVVIVIKK
jgi:hypothetical protein